MEHTKETAALLARLDDLCGRAARGELAIGPFLSLRESVLAARYLNGVGVAYRLFGGYGDAERCRPYLLPSYMEDAEQSDFLSFLSDFDYESRVACLRVMGSGYRNLDHRAYLGSLLGLGLERSVIGDILVLGENGIGALVFCDETIAPFLLQEWHKVGSDTVKVMRVPLSEITVPERRFSDIHDTLASPRLDGVVAALCRLSRDRAKAAVEGGLVELNFEREERPDRTVEEGAILSVRGFGRYRILSVSEQTKKGRFRLEAQKYL